MQGLYNYFPDSTNGASNLIKSDTGDSEFGLIKDRSWTKFNPA